MSKKERYARYQIEKEAVNTFFSTHFLDAHKTAPKEIILDFDATDDLIHGDQEGRYFNGYYGNYCYMPLYAFSGEHLLRADLREANVDASSGTEAILEDLVKSIRQRWPQTRILLRADGGFCRNSIMEWCEKNGIAYILGLPKNSRLVDAIAKELKSVRRKFLRHKKAKRKYKSFMYKTTKSWSKERRVIAKAEHLRKGSNPRFIVTNLKSDDAVPRGLYEKVYCARGDMENRIKEQQLDLFADRTSSHDMEANQIRLWLSSVAYLLLEGLRRLGLAGTEMAKAQAGTIRLKLLKIGALVKVSVRRVHVLLSGGYPYAELYRRVQSKLEKLRPKRVEAPG